MSDPTQTVFCLSPDSPNISGGASGGASESALQGYFDWQVTTLMLAYDLNDPVDGHDEHAGEQRRRSIEEEVRKMTLAVVPDLYLNDPSLDWPPDLMMAITRTTLKRAADIAGL